MAVKLLLISLFVATCIQVSLSSLSMTAVSSMTLPWNIVPRGGGRTEPQYGLNRGAAEKTALDVDNMVAYTGGHNLLHVINFTDVVRPRIVRSLRVLDPIIDIAECGNLVAFTSRPRRSRTDPGMVHIYQKYPVFGSLCNLTVGSNPKSLKFDYKCDTIIIANEGPAAENVEQEMFVNPEGTVSVVRINNTFVNPALSMCQPMPYGSDVRHIDFRLFNDPALAPLMEQQFIRNTYKGQMDGEQHTFSMNVEPEYVTLDPWQPTAWVTLQENNAIAEVWYENMTAIIHPLGLKNWTNYGIDASTMDAKTRQNEPRRGIKFNRYPIESLLQADAVEMMDINGEVFLITANEGAPLNYVCQSCEVETEYMEMEEAAELAGDYLISERVNPEVRRAMTDPARLGQLRISLVDGLQEQGSEMIDRPVFFGGRGISMFKVNPYGLDLVWDSGDSISKGVQDLHPNAFNHPPFGNQEVMEQLVIPSNLINRRWDSWSPFMGPECQSLAIGQYNMTHKVIIVGIKGANALGIFTVPLLGNYTQPNFESVYRDGDIRGNVMKSYNQIYRADVLKPVGDHGIGNLDPDSIQFVPADRSRSRPPMVLVTSRVSGTVNLYRISEVPRAQLLRQQRTSLDGGVGCIAPSTTLSLLFSILTLLYVTLRH
ncbi:mesenchyme-specific cell surface glycoprotein-like [Strongylocentrotus purpuratus]|uniref:Choice-of-anchor I domain-containing protein n=1 Tax=Strongylocentrotus purpuratus TaxID=7668 RepID=A0A7M7NX32_STRPU|nr:mesenchyme-specific cell surface glycoprotein-like [Strongylocentrotus purpuratus]